ncbi:unnamed protein product [Musa hybrid cultivar]
MAGWLSLCVLLLHTQLVFGSRGNPCYGQSSSSSLFHSGSVLPPDVLPFGTVKYTTVLRDWEAVHDLRIQLKPIESRLLQQELHQIRDLWEAMKS